MLMTKSVHLSKKPPATTTTTTASVRTSLPVSNVSAADKSTRKKPSPIGKTEGNTEEAHVENDAHHETAPAVGNTASCTAPVPPTSLAKRKKKKKAKSKASVSSQGIPELDEDSRALEHSSTPNSGSHWLVDTRNSAVASSKKDDEFWSSMSNSEERQKIREFWLGLGEEERRSLVKVEKDAVLRKMKEQQKNSCNCSVCGKKRTAIEDELEVLYDAYYEELEQYANHQQQTRFYNAADGALAQSHYERASPVSYEDGYDGQLDEDEDEEEDDDYSPAYDDEINSQSDQSENLSEGEKTSYDDAAFTDRFSQNTAAAGVDHFNFGNSLTVKGGILTVADDLLKNDGKKFLDMMERLAERRIQKEDEVMEQTDDYYDDIDEDEDEVYDEEEEEAGTDEQRMEEGRRMFQIFAARMFEQRVLAAYREKVARERQQRLIQELEEEDRLRQERELKKQKEKERKKDKKRQLKKQKEEERLAREAQRKAEEEAARAERERKLEEERKKREQERLKKEEERRQKEEERLRKEEEKRRRLKEERERAAEKERKRKEKEEQERREREEKERKEREEKERKEREEREERERKEREEKARAAKRKVEEEQRRAKETEERERAEREKREAKAAATTSAASSSKSAKSTEPSPAMQSTATTSAANQAMPSNVPIRPVDDAARQKALMDVLVGSSTQASAARLGSDVNPPNLDMPVPPHPLLPLNGLPHSLPIAPARLAGQPATSPTHPFAAIDRAVMPIGFGRLSSSFDAGSSSSSASAKVISRPGSHIAPIGQPPSGRRQSSNAGPIGSPVGARANRVLSADESSASSAIGSGKRPIMAADRGETTNSFFSNFLFGEPTRDAYQDQSTRSRSRLDKNVERRFSLESSNLAWTNGWTASTALSDNVHGRLFGDVLADRSTTILERAKAAYLKLDEITQTKYYNPSRFHSLAQLHRMMCDMYYDLQVDMRELYEVISSPLSGFETVNNAHSGWLVRLEGLRPGGAAVGSPAIGSVSSSTSIVQPSSVPHLPSSPPGPLFANSMPPPPQMKGNTQLFGSMS